MKFTPILPKNGNWQDLFCSRVHYILTGERPVCAECGRYGLTETDSVHMTTVTVADTQSFKHRLLCLACAQQYKDTLALMAGLLEITGVKDG